MLWSAPYAVIAWGVLFSVYCQYFSKYMLNGKNSTFFSKNSGKNLRIWKNVCTFALGKQKQLTIQKHLQL